MTSGVQKTNYDCQHVEQYEQEDSQLVVTMVASEKKEDVRVKEKDHVKTAVYKLNLHCIGCARAIEKPIIRTQGVQNVNIDVESGKVMVKGVFNAKKMHELIEKKSKRKVEWLSPKPEHKVLKKEAMIENIQEEEVAKTTVIKLHLPCQKCAIDLENELLKLRGVYRVKIDRGEETCTIVGIVEEENLIKYIHKKAGKRGEIIRPKQKSEVKKIKEDVGEKIEESKSTDVVRAPYFIHCTHAPQWFSDEDPNSCTVM
ncbi:heavy metal-associated isoprenylated plant protein 4-like [Phalaenopsis equestris]|uniref:heavy metal-associated isoprenylated plant protein 4-like n=1 Tax=Phalaenopsis equestris TaxID=78828 RepID=UPI0009E2DAF4|nr:heavy metal-associated isoprenylated plant protein 4-like [Phalaenopsis equestris]